MGLLETCLFGGVTGDRTLDLSLAKAALSQLSYDPLRLFLSPFLRDAIVLCA